MAHEVSLGRGATGKLRSFWVGLLLSIITVGVYGFCWYYFVNDELKDIGRERDDENLATSSPALSVTAILVGGYLVVPPLLSIYNYGQRIRRAQRLGGVPEHEQINPVTAFLLMFPGILLVIPYFAHFWYVQKHQNIALRAAARLPSGPAGPALRAPEPSAATSASGETSLWMPPTSRG